MSDIGLSSDELAEIRADVNDLLPDTCTIQKMTLSPSTIGEGVKTYTDRATGVACRIDPERSFVPTGLELLGYWGGYILHTGRFICTLPYDQEVEITDLIIANNVTFEVGHVDDVKSWAISKRVLIKELDT